MNLASENSSPCSEPMPFGLWATLGFSAVIILTHLACGILAATAFVTFGEGVGPDVDPHQLAYNGTVVTLSILVSSPLVFGLTFLFANRRRGLKVKDYLGLHEVDWKTVVRWLLAVFLFALLSDLVTLLSKRPVVPDFMLHVYRTATYKALLWIALVIAAPLSEEIFFRGFLFYGIQKTALGSVGAILLPSLIWTFLHIQYDVFSLTMVFALGVLLGYARWRSRSVYIPIAMHGLMNFIASAEVMLQIGGTPPPPYPIRSHLRAQTIMSWCVGVAVRSLKLTSEMRAL